MDYISQSLSNLTFPLLGKLLNFIGLYRVLYKYDAIYDDNSVLCNENGDIEIDSDCHNEEFIKRAMTEGKFQSIIWNLLSAISEEKDYIDGEVLVDILVLLHDPGTEESDIVAEDIESNKNIYMRIVPDFRHT